MASIDLLLLRKLQERIEEELLVRADMLTAGLATNYEEYKAKVAYIRGLRDCLIWAKEINDKLIGKN